jgi:hypothetical protein
MTVAVACERVPDRLAISVRPYGRKFGRWAQDETGPDNAITELTISDEMPGGYKDMSGTLARNPQVSWPDLDPYAELKAYGAGGQSLWEGRMNVAPGSSGREPSLKVNGVGHQVALDDNKDITLGYINQDQSQWQDASTARKTALVTASVDPGSPQMNPDPISGAPFIELGKDGPWGASNPPHITAHFDAGPGIKLSSMFFNWFVQGGIGLADANWQYLFRLATDDTMASYDQTVKLAGSGVGSGTGTVTATNNVRRLCEVVLYYTGGANAGAAQYLAKFAPVIYGLTGLTPAGTGLGFTAKQMLMHAIQNKGAPLTAVSDDFDDDGFVIPQAWFRDPVALSEIVKYMTKFSLYDWFVFEDKRFQYKRPRSYGKRWRVRLSESELDENGMDGSRLWDSIVVQYKGTDGNTRTAGPVGSGSDTESTTLSVTDPEHPAVRAPVTRRDVLVLKGTSTPTIAVAAGVRFLSEAALLNTSGSAKLTGFVYDDRGLLHPVSHVRSGDEIAFIDAAEKSYRKIVRREYAHDSREASIDLDAPPQGLDALLERLDAVLITAGLASG